MTHFLRKIVSNKTSRTTNFILLFFWCLQRTFKELKLFFFIIIPNTLDFMTKKNSFLLKFSPEKNSKKGFIHKNKVTVIYNCPLKTQKNGNGILQKKLLSFYFKRIFYY